jgi:hypothetical protein
MKNLKKTLFLGNGINRLSGNCPDWSTLLKQINDKEHNKLNNVPYTIQYEHLLLNFKKEQGFEKVQKEENVKKRIKEQLEMLEPNEFHSYFSSLNYDNFITTNYDYLFTGNLGTGISNRTEELYSIRRKTVFKDKIFWFIHGELESLKSIMLGLDHYCGSIGKIDGYLKGTYNFNENGENIKTVSLRKKITENKYDLHSWIELFFNSNIDIVGFGLDYSETDIWWIINKRLRFKLEGININNKITYYTNEIDSVKKRILENLDITVVVIQTNNYKELYTSVLNLLNK